MGGAVKAEALTDAKTVAVSPPPPRQVRDPPQHTLTRQTPTLVCFASI